MPGAWFDSLRADAVFGWRQMWKKKVTSAAAILSLALAIGACTSAFRLIDALLFRPLPVAEPESLYLLSRQGMDRGKPFGSWGYADFHQLREAVRGQVDLIAVSWVQRMELTYKRDGGMEAEMEKANVQYVSGWMFGSFGLHPALGRLLSENDDLKQGASPVAVLSYDYWTRRFNRDPKVIGRTMVVGRKFGIGNDVFEIIGVAGDGFTGTDPGTVTDIFAPTMMSALTPRPEAGAWLKTYVRVPRGSAPEPVRDRLRSAFGSFEEETKRWKVLSMNPAPGGISSTQTDYRQALAALSVLVALVLLIACANVANLMTAQAAARAREMALRVSIGARRWRLVQLVLVESAMIALLASSVGAVFAWWSAPFVVSRINPPDNPARLFLPADWRVLVFSLALTLVVTFLFGLTPALRASVGRPGDGAERRRGSSFATPVDAWADRRAGCVLFSRNLCRGNVCGYAQSAIARGHRIPHPAASESRHRVRERTTCCVLGSTDRAPARDAGGGVSNAGGMACTGRVQLYVQRAFDPWRACYQRLGRVYECIAGLAGCDEDSSSEWPRSACH